MKMFIDTANIEAIKRFYEMGIINGVTTNPTIMSRERKGFNQIVSEIIQTVNGPISVEAISTEAENIVKEAKQLASLHPNIVVKVPVTPEGLKAVKALSKEGVKTNVTLVFSTNQGLLAAKAGATYVSVFIGRLDDNGQRGMQVVQDLVKIFKTYSFKSQVIAASIRHPQHVIEAAKAGAHVATIPVEVLEKMIKHPLTDAGLQKFLDDWKKVQEHTR
jgi:transaldolase